MLICLQFKEMRTRNYVILTVLAVIFCYWVLSSPAKPEQTLALLHIVFRHGDRTPVPLKFINVTRLFPKSSIFPYGMAELTLKGKRRMFGLGKALRERYSSFLGDSYFADLFEASTSSYSRTVVSLQCVLAALFPPSKDWEVEDGLLWQPAYFNQNPFSTDNTIATYRSCSKVLYSEFVVSKENAATVKYVEEKIGTNFTHLAWFTQFENTLQVMEELGLDIPGWAKPMRTKLREVSLQIYTDIIRKSLPLVSGKLLEKINDDSVQKINGVLLPTNRKLFLYSGHDINLFGLLISIGAYTGQNITYGSYIAIEIHKINEIYGVKMFLGTENFAAPELLSIKNCGHFCPLDQFHDLTKILYPPEPWCS